MVVEEIEKLLEIIRPANISEITVGTGNPRTTVTVRKAPSCALPKKKSAKPVKQDAKQTEEHETDKAIYITAPMVGIFHNAGNALETGSKVKIGQQVGTIESMKLMNDIMSENEGSVAEVLIEDGMPVEYGQNLLKLEGS